MSTQAVALIRNPVQLKVGDLVVVPEKTNSVWAGDGIVTLVNPVEPSGPNYVNVKLTTGRMAGREGSFRAASLEPQAQLTYHGFAPNQRVVNQFGQHGTVVGQDGRYVRVQLDKQGYTSLWYPYNLGTPVTPTGEPKALVAAPGISKPSRRTVFVTAVNIALSLGATKRYVNADDVQTELVKHGYTSTHLGNAAGAIFRGANWHDTGTTVASQRKGTHHRKITVWEYTGNPAPASPVQTPAATPAATLPATPAPVPAVPQGPFVVETYDGSGIWRRSFNYSMTKTGRPLRYTQFATFAEAEAEAVAQQASNKAGRRYRASALGRPKLDTPNDTPPAPTTAPVLAEKYIIQVNNRGNGAWGRSANTTLEGERLSVHEFSTLEEAQKEAARQQQRSAELYQQNGYDYRAVPLEGTSVKTS